MPKLKTHKGTAKRVKITGSGKVVRERAFGNHILAKKSKARKRNMKTAAVVNGKINKNIKRALGVQYESKTWRGCTRKTQEDAKAS